MDIPKINPKVISSLVNSDILNAMEKHKDIQAEKAMLERNAKEAMIKMAEKNWVERNPIIYGILMATVGALITIMLERLL